MRYADLVAWPLVSGAENGERFAILGAGDPPAHILENSSFEIGGRRQRTSGAETPDSRDRVEVVIVHGGRWRLALGTDGEEGGVDLSPGDVAAAPPHRLLRVELMGEGPGFVWTILGGAEPTFSVDPPRDDGPPDPRPAWRIDTSSGTYELKSVEPAGDKEPPGAGSFDAPSGAPWPSDGLATAESLIANSRSSLAFEGVEEAGVVSSRATRDGFEPGPIVGAGLQAFSLRRLRLDLGAYLPMHVRDEAEVLLIQEGALEARWPEGSAILAAGDAALFPKGLARAFRNTSSAAATAFVVRGTDDPAPPRFLGAPST